LLAAIVVLKYLRRSISFDLTAQSRR